MLRVVNDNWTVDTVKLLETYSLAEILELNNLTEEDALDILIEEEHVTVWPVV